jgi:two-component system response regulator FixJ
MSASRTIAIIDDDDAVRHSTVGLLRRAGHRVEAYTDGAEFLASDLPENLACILLDMRMPGVDGLAVMRALLQRGVSSPILVLTGHGDIPMAVEAMRLGAVDFFEKPYPAQHLLQAIGRVLKAGPGAKGGIADPEAVAKIARLSQRQQQVLKGILKGQPNKIIAYELGLSIRTVEAYRAQLMEKLGVRGTAEAVRMALAAGLDEASGHSGPNIE